MASSAASEAVAASLALARSLDGARLDEALRRAAVQLGVSTVLEGVAVASGVEAYGEPSPGEVDELVQ